MEAHRDRPLICPRCRDLPLVETTTAQGVAIDSCTRCAGVWYERGELTAMFAGALKREAVAPAAMAAIDIQQSVVLICPVCAPRPLQERKDPADPNVVGYECHMCGGTWLDKEVWGKLYRKRRQANAPAVNAARTYSTGDGPLAFSRAAFDSVWVNIGVPPAMALVAIILAMTGFDQLLVVARIFLHEIGHAVPAWFSGRAALPLPFGITFVREEQSWWTSLCLAFLIGVFGYRSFREGRKVAVGLAVALLGLQVYLTWFTLPFRSLMYVTAGGTLGEFVVSAFLIVLFHHPLPDRLRWDFWRFLVFIPAMVTFVGALKQWIDISNKVAAMPTLSMFGVPGDGQSDITRLINDYGWSADQVSQICVGVGLLAATTMVIHYGYIVVTSLFFDDDDDDGDN